MDKEKITRFVFSKMDSEKNPIKHILILNDLDHNKFEKKFGDLSKIFTDEEQKLIINILLVAYRRNQIMLFGEEYKYNDQPSEIIVKSMLFISKMADLFPKFQNCLLRK